MTGINGKRGFTLLEMLVASLLLSMMVVALSMVFSSSASAWRIGRAGVNGLHETRHKLSECQLASDNALPYLFGRTKGSSLGYIRSVWLDGKSLTDQDGVGVKNGRGFDTTDIYHGKFGVDPNKPFKSRITVGSINGNSFMNYIVGVGSAGPDRQWNTKDDIATWPKDYGGGL